MAQAPGTTSLEVGFRPKQNIPEELKDLEWAQRNVDWCVSMSPIYWKNYDNHLYDLYNGVRKDEDYKHITETYGVEFPAGKIKHIPLVRPLLNVLEGEYEQRPLNFNVRSEDNDSVNMKLEKMSNNLLDSIVEMIRTEGGESVDIGMDNLEKYYKEDFQTNREIAAHHALKYYINKHHLERKLKENFVDKIITGKELYRVVINRIGEDPEFVTIRPGQLYWANNNVKWVKECDWAVYPVRMSPTQILDAYGERMNPNDRTKVEDWIDQYYRDSYKLNSYQDADKIIEDTEEWNSYYAALQGMITVYNVEWKSIRKVQYVENPNPHVSDAPFIKFEDKINNPHGARKKNLQERYVQDLWQGLRIGDDMYVDLGRVKYARRDFSKPSKVYLTFNGPTYSGKIKPYSLVKETEDLQELYDILHYHKENLIAISGVKGMVMDSSQIPDFKQGSFEANIKMWMYYKKLGTAWINRAQEGADTTYNQFGTYDDTMGPGLEAVLAIIAHLEELTGRIVGVNRQRQGSIAQREGKGTTEHALVQSALSTEPIFAEHGEFIRQALEDILDACKVAWKNGYTSSYVSDQYLQQIFTFDPESSNSDFGVYVTDLESDKRSIDELKAFSYQLVQQGMMEFDDLMPLFRKSNLMDIEKQVSTAMARKKKELAEKEGQAQAIQDQMAMAKSQSEIEKLKAEIQKIYAESQQIVMDVQNDTAKISNEAEKDRADIALETKRVALEQAELNASVIDKQNDIQKKKEISND